MKKIMMGLLALTSLTAFAGNPHKIASELGAQGFSCQNEKFVLEQLLSESSLNLEAIDAAKKIYFKCVDRVRVTVSLANGDAQKVFEALQSKKQACGNQIEKLEELLSEDVLNYEEIGKAKENFEKCRSGAKKVITNNSLFSHQN